MGTITRLHSPGRIWRAKNRNKPADAIDIGPGTPWANPFVPGRDGTRADVIDQFQRWVRNGPDCSARWMRKHIDELIGRDVFCTCAPDLCHGEVLVGMAAAHARKTERIESPPGLRMRLSVTEKGLRKHYLVTVSEAGPDGLVLEAPENARWMLGNRCSMIAAWMRARDGVATPLQQIHDFARTTLKEPIAS